MHALETNIYQNLNLWLCDNATLTLFNRLVLFISIYAKRGFYYKKLKSLV